tara:strand:- start:420 stop:761 length:342 start_codon:yes stop_codon:yes gene_type:complete
MNPLDNLMKKSYNPKDILLTYLPDQTLLTIQDKLYYDSEAVDLFLNQKIWCIDKSTGKIVYSGKIFKINNNWISLKCSNKNLYIDTDDYYIFIGHRKTKKNDYQYFQALLDML